MLSALMIGVHLSISGSVERAEPFGRHLFPGGKLLADIASPLLHRGSAKRARDRGITSRLMSLGVPFGAQMPCQIEMWKTRQAASSTSDLGRRRRGAALRHRKARTPPDFAIDNADEADR